MSTAPLPPANEDRTGQQASPLRHAGAARGSAPRRGLARGAGVLIAAVLLVVGLAACSLDTSGEGSATPTASGTETGDMGGSVGVDVEVGDCINLGGTDEAATAEPAACGSLEADHKVNGKAPTVEECISDSDAYYYETRDLTGELGALCLDVDWVQGDCYDYGESTAERVDCDAPGPNVVRAGERIEGVSDPAACPTGGIPYAERNFTVCVEALGSVAGA